MRRMLWILITHVQDALMRRHAKAVRAHVQHSSAQSTRGKPCDHAND